MKGLLALPLLLLPLALSAQRKPGSPIDALPPNEEVLTSFGERADISPDNKRVVFMDKSFGDAFVIDLKTRVIHCLTCSVPGATFLRINAPVQWRLHPHRTRALHRQSAPAVRATTNCGT